MRAFLFVTIATVVAVCATGSSLTPAQLRAMQKRTFESTTYDIVYRSFKTVLQEDGYTLRKQDPAAGLLVAYSQKSNRFWASMSEQPSYRTGEGFAVLVRIDRVDGRAVESTLTLRKLEQFSMGGQDTEDILEGPLYARLYAKVRAEIERRKASRR